MHAACARRQPCTTSDRDCVAQQRREASHRHALSKQRQGKPSNPPPGGVTLRFYKAHCTAERRRKPARPRSAVLSQLGRQTRQQAR